MDEFDKIAEALAADPAIKGALEEHNAACEDDEATCIVCNTKNALKQLMFVSVALDNEAHECDDEACQAVSELDIADSMIDSLPAALQLLSVVNTAIGLLSRISQAATFIIHSNELEQEEDDEPLP